MTGSGATPPHVNVRRATSADLDDVVRLRLALLREYPDHPIYGRLRANAEQLARPVFAAQLESGNESTFLATVDGRPVGILRTVEAAAPPFLMPERYCYVSSVFVVPEQRRHGVLRELVDRAVEWCRQRGLGEMRLHSVGSRESASAAWEALGFEVVEQVRVRRIDAGASTRIVRDAAARDAAARDAAVRGSARETRPRGEDARA
jgi:ribosomal protein S18 acetylase RimI-like enzyme